MPLILFNLIMRDIGLTTRLESSTSRPLNTYLSTHIYVKDDKRVIWILHHNWYIFPR